MLRSLRWAIAWALVILVLCLMPGKALPEWNWFALLDLDKLVHAGLFFVLAVLLAQAFYSNRSPAHYLVWACIISIAYGLATEFMQGMEALGRRTDLNDMIANSTGAVLAAGYVTWKERQGKPIAPFAFLR
ncbi:MAG: VanZ family protein [Flavobacteriales bacterium]|nr:VanZ family protein [Flavobacteriales bacterium]